MKKIFLLVFCMPLIANTQVAMTGNGIVFEKTAAWKEVLEKAKAQNKYIFVDCYATWCGPCKQMDKEIYPLAKVGDEMNNKFISVKVQFDSSASDNEIIKKMYGDAHELMTLYKISTFPTYLFFDPTGLIVHRAIGTRDESGFINLLRDALDQNKQLYAQFRNYKKVTDYRELPALARKAKSAKEMEWAHLIGNEYINNYLLQLPEGELYTRENLIVLIEFTNYYKDIGFEILRTRHAKIDSVFGRGTASGAVKKIIGEEEVALHPGIVNDDLNWKLIEKEAKKKFGDDGQIAILNKHFLYYWSSKDWPRFCNYFPIYFQKIGTNNIFHINNSCWDIFEHCNDIKILNTALKVLDPHKEVDNESMDTYANLLYKVGRTKEALEWETKAVKKIEEEAAAKKRKPNSSYREILEKMERGEKTWPSN